MNTKPFGQTGQMIELCSEYLATIECGNAYMTWQEHTVKCTVQISTQNRAQSFGHFRHKLIGSEFESSYSHLNSLSNSHRHSANADVIADVKSKIIVSCRHFFADVIFSAT